MEHRLCRCSTDGQRSLSENLFDPNLALGKDDRDHEFAGRRDLPFPGTIERGLDGARRFEAVRHHVSWVTGRKARSRSGGDGCGKDSTVYSPSRIADLWSKHAISRASDGFGAEIRVG